MKDILKKLFNTPSRLGFTLAEVLIVLGIIGMVAEMTIPTLTANTQKQVLKTSFKKAYTDVAQALAFTKIELGVGNLHTTYAYYDGSSYVYSPEFIAAFYKQLKVIGSKDYSTPPVNYNKTADAYFWAIGWEAPNQLLPDGSTIHCMVNAGQINISVDTNGPAKKPNRAGYDIFVFWVDDRDAIQPYGGPNTPMSSYTLCSQSGTETFDGLGCAYYALTDKNPDDNTKGYWASLK